MSSAATAKKPGFRMKFVKFWHNITSNPSVTVKETLGYSSGLLGNSAAQDVEAFALTLFLTRFMGLTAFYILILEFVAKIASVVADPVAGLILDRKTKSGRSMAKIFSLITPLPLAISSIFLFVVPNIGFTQRVIYVFIFYLIYIFCDSFYDMSLNTISARMTANPKDRKNFYTVAQFAETLGGMLPSGLIPIFVAAFAHKEQTIYLIFAIIFGVLGFFFMIIPAFTLKDKTHFKYIRKEQPVKMSFKALALNRPMWMLILATFFDSLRQVTYTGLAYFYLETLDAFWMATIVGTVSSALSYVGIILVPIICRKFSARDVIMGGYFYTGILYAILLATGPFILSKARPFWLITLLIGLAGLPNGGMSSCRKILLADSTDYMEYKTWKKYGTPIRSEAMVFATNATANRIKTLFKSLLFPAGLAIIGYVSAYSFGNSTIQVIQSETVLTKIFYLIAICGVAGNVIPGIFMIFDNYTGKRRENIIAELNVMRNAKKVEYEKEQAKKKIAAK